MIEIPLSEPRFQGNEWQYLKECLDTGWVSTAGPFVARFEREVAAIAGVKHGVAASSGTAALHVALLACGVGPGDEVLVPALTFIAPANAVRYTGAMPVFIDVEPEYWQLDPAKTSEFLARECRRDADGKLVNKTSGRRIAAILAVHTLGHPADMDAFAKLAGEYGLRLIEDAAESLGARYRGRAAGSLSDVACFSFNGNKIVTAGGGGMLVTNDENLARRARYLTTQAKDDPDEYIHHEIGFNYRLTNIQAALGCAQLEVLGDRIARRREAAHQYHELLLGIHGVIPMPEAPWARSTFWLYTARFTKEFPLSNRDLLRELASRGVQSRLLWQPLPFSRAHRESQSYKVETAEALYKEALSLPSSPSLTSQSLLEIVDIIKKLS